MLRTLGIVVLALSLSGCVATKGTVKISVEDARAKPFLKLAKPGALKLEKVKWRVVTAANVEQVIKEIGGDGMVFALSPDGFKKMQRNNLKLASLLKKHRKIILAYEEYYKK